MTDINRHGNEENDGIDGISFLPDDVRTHILSFLTTKEAVQTCILSKRWINIWASVPDLIFDIEEFGCLESFDEDEDMAVVFIKLELFMRSVLEKREASHVNIFQLWLHSDIYWPHTQAVVDCIGDVMKLGPRECFVEMGSHEKLNLNTCPFFTCESLIHLHLFLSTSADDPNVPIELNSVNLPCLKTLNLDNVTMSDDSLKKLLLGCPVLEELVLHGYFIGITEICSNTLKKLELFSAHDTMKLHISAPNLLHLDITVYFDIIVMDMGEIMSLNMPLLVDAHIFLPGWYDLDKYITMGTKLIHNLSNVKSLQLELPCPKGKVQVDFSSYPVFNNLKCLKIVSCRFHVFDLLPYFLHHSPKLQELTLTNIDELVTEFVDEELTQELGRALVQREFLKTVRIVGFKNNNGFVDQLINKLLTHVKIIGDIVIDP